MWNDFWGASRDLTITLTRELRWGGIKMGIWRACLGEAKVLTHMENLGWTK